MKAEELAQMHVNIATKALGKSHEATITATVRLVLIYWSKRDRLWGYAGSRQKSEINLSLIKNCQRVLGEDHPITLGLMSHSARSLAHKT